MTDFEKVKNYYRHFDEKNRLQNDNSGKLEFLMTVQKVWYACYLILKNGKNERNNRKTF
jgi:hypothetical protein